MVLFQTLTFSMTWIMPIMRSLHHLSHKPNFEKKAARQYTTQSYTSEGKYMVISQAIWNWAPDFNF